MIDGCNLNLFTEPPDTEPYVRWCEREAGSVNPAPYSIVVALNLCDDARPHAWRPVSNTIAIDQNEIRRTNTCRSA